MATGVTSVWKRALYAAGMVVIPAAVGHAQTPVPGAPPIPRPQIFYSNVEPLTDTAARQANDPRPQSAAGAVQFYDWLVYGTLATGAAYDDNVNSTPTNPIKAYGARLQPAIIAEHNTGIQRTYLYGIGDIRYYPSVGKTQVMDTSAGAVHVWEIQRDFILRMQGQASRSEDALGLTDTGTGLIAVDPVKSLRFYGSTSLEKGFGRFFTALGGSATRENFDDTKTLTGTTVDESFRDGTTTTVAGRLGFHVTPIVYSFVEPSVNWAWHTSSLLDSQGYRMVVGLGTGRIGLMNGEIYGGYMAQTFTDPTISSLTDPVYGGRVSYYPTRFLTFTASLDQALATSDFTTRAFQPGSVTKTNTARFETKWDVLRYLTLGGTFEFRHSDYLNSFRKDDTWRASADITYWVHERFGITFDYTHVVLNSTVAGADYTHDLVSLGGKTRF